MVFRVLLNTSRFIQKYQYLIQLTGDMRGDNNGICSILNTVYILIYAQVQIKLKHNMIFHKNNNNNNYNNMY